MGWQLCSLPRPPLRTAPSHGHLGPPEHGVGARLRRGAGLLAEEKTTPPPPARSPGASHSHTRDKRLNKDPAADPGNLRSLLLGGDSRDPRPSPAPATPGMKGGSQRTRRGQRQLPLGAPWGQAQPGRAGEAGRPLHASDQEEAQGTRAGSSLWNFPPPPGHVGRRRINPERPQA